MVDELDKGDIDLPNDLLNVLEEGSFEIDELTRAGGQHDVRVHGDNRHLRIADGRVTARQFPFIVMTSNGEREFPAPFLRRCIRITIPPPDLDELEMIVSAHLDEFLSKLAKERMVELIRHFLSLREQHELATDQLLNAVYVVLGDGRERSAPAAAGDDRVIQLLLKQLTGTPAT